tara:strand:- start:5607 stop:6401 length:795 start_codon:yes stop_codon:yes gene_type:complete
VDKKTIIDGEHVYCLSSSEAKMLYEHINGYLNTEVVINENDIIIDIGANIGIFGIKLSKLFNNKITILSFEPIKDIYNVLKKNSLLTRNKNFKVFECGISNKNEQANFTYYPNSPALSTANPEAWDDNKDLITAVEGNLKHSPSSLWWTKFIPRFLYPLIVKILKQNPVNINCNVETVSQIIDKQNLSKIDLLKIDCEGNELKVLQGIKKIHWSIIKQLIIEVHDIDGRLDNIKSILEQQNYRVKVVKEESMKRTNLFNVIAIS